MGKHIQINQLKTINGESLIGEGDIKITGGSGSGVDNGNGNGGVDNGNGNGGHGNIVFPHDYTGAYGIEWNSSNDTYTRVGASGYTSIQGMLKRCVLNSDGTVNYYLDPNNSNYKADGTAAVLNGNDGNVMVEVPKTYIKLTTSGAIDRLEIALAPAEGFVCSPSHVLPDGTEIDYRYYRAYKGHVKSGKLMSISGVIPTRSVTATQFRVNAKANGIGWGVTDWSLLTLIKLYCFIEFNDFIVTKYLGNGNDSTGDYGKTTGTSNSLGNKSTTAPNNNFMSYRGIENFYAEAFELIDGINFQGSRPFVNVNRETFAFDVFTGDYKNSGVNLPSSGFITRCALSNAYGLIPIASGGSNTTKYGDYVYSSTGIYVAYHGGYASHGSYCGASCLHAHYSAAHSNANLGCGLTK